MLIYPKPEDFKIYAGRSFTAEWYYRKDGVMPAFDYYMSLMELDKERFNDIVEYFCDRPHGILLPKTWYRIVDQKNDIYEFKPRDARFFNFTTAGRKIIVTNAYHKHSQQMTKQDKEGIKISAQCRQDYFQRIKEETYYE